MRIKLRYNRAFTFSLLLESLFFFDRIEEAFINRVTRTISSRLNTPRYKYKENSLETQTIRRKIRAVPRQLCSALSLR